MCVIVYTILSKTERLVNYAKSIDCDTFCNEISNSTCYPSDRHIMTKEVLRYPREFIPERISWRENKE